MKLIILLIVLAFNCTFMSGQLLNGSFEDVYTNSYGITEAAHWKTNKDSLEWWVYYDSTSYHLDRAALLLGYEATSAWFGCESSIRQSILDPDLAEGDVLSFYSRSHPTPGNAAEEANFIAELRYFKNGQYLGSDQYIETSFSNSYSYKEVPVTIFEADSLVVIFVSGAQNGADDGCYNHTNTYVDKVELGGAIVNADVTETAIQLYAYAAFGYVTVKGELESVEQYTIYDMGGRVVSAGKVLDSSILLPSRGVYVLQVITSEGASHSIKLANF